MLLSLPGVPFTHSTIHHMNFSSFKTQVNMANSRKPLPKPRHLGFLSWLHASTLKIILPYILKILYYYYFFLLSSFPFQAVCFFRDRKATTALRLILLAIDKVTRTQCIAAQKMLKEHSRGKNTLREFSTSTARSKQTWLSLP